MTKYIVIENFLDLKDNKHLYRVGDEYPRDGYKPTKKRLEELLSYKNRLGKPLIAEVEEGGE